MDESWAGMDRQDYPVAGRWALSVFAMVGSRPGPTLATIGGIHGDEYEGPLVLSGLLRDIDPQDLSGTWIVVPLANAAAAAAGTRCTPSDGRNLARCFPGDPEGEPTERVAALIHEKAIATADCVLDLHSGGTALESAFFAGYADAPNGVGERARAVAEAFGAPVIWRHEAPTAPGRTMSSAGELGIPGIYVETTGGPFPDTTTLAAYRRGVVRVMRHLGMLEDERLAVARTASAALAEIRQPLWVEGSGNIDTSGPAPVSGLCTCHVSPLQRLEPGTLCFTITDISGEVQREVRNRDAGVVMFCRRSRWVEEGETLLTLAREADRQVRR